MGCKCNYNFVISAKIVASSYFDQARSYLIQLLLKLKDYLLLTEATTGFRNRKPSCGKVERFYSVEKDILKPKRGLSDEHFEMFAFLKRN